MNMQKNVWKTIEMENVREYDSLIADLLLALIFENFRDTCIKINNVNPAHFYSVSCVASIDALKKTTIQLKVTADINVINLELEVKYVILFSVNQKQITNTWKVVMNIKNHRTHVSIKTIFMVQQRHFQ